MYCGKKLVAGFVFLFVMVAQNVFAQENFTPGYIINALGDTVKGRIDRRNWDRNPDQISFKRVTGKVEKYAPLQIKEFKTDEDDYVSAIVDYEIEVRAVGDQHSKGEFKKIRDSVFLQTVVRGSKSLYYFQNKDDAHFFFIGSDKGIEVLTDKKYLKVNPDGTMNMVEIKFYQGQLAAFLNDCSTIAAKIKSTDYVKSALLNLFTAYYKCIGKPIQFQKTKFKPRIMWGVTAGASLQSFSYSSSTQPTDYFNHQKYSSSTTPTGGLFLEILHPDVHRRWSIYNELMYTSYKTTGVYTYVKDANLTQRYTSTFGASYFRYNIQMRFRQPIGRAQLFGNLGWSLSVKAKPFTDKYIYYQSFYNDVSTKESSNFPADATRSSSNGFLAGIGVQFGKASFETRYQSSPGLSRIPSIGSSVQTLNLLLAYRF